MAVSQRNTCRPLWLVALAVSLFTGACSEQGPHGTLRLAYQHKIVSIDPHAQDDGVTTAVLAAVYESMVSLGSGAEVRPALARSWTTPDATTWRFALREGVHFHDGSLVTTADVVASLDRVRAVSGSGVATYLEGIAKIRELADRPGVVEITTTSPFPLLLARLAMVAIVPEDFDPEAPVGTGPYSWVDGELAGPIHLQRWPDYWGDPVDFESVEITILEDDEAIEKSVQGGELDVMARVKTSFLSDHLVTREWRVERIPSAATTVLGINQTRPPLNDHRVRAAIDFAIDRSALVNRVFPDGAADPAVCLVPAEVFGFSPDTRKPAADLVEARRLLDEAGVKEGTVLRLDQASGIYTPLLEALTESLNAVGIDLELMEHSYETYYRRIEQGQNELFLFGWTFRNADSSDFLESMVHSRDPKRLLGLMNGNGYSHPEVDRWIEEAGREPRSKVRLDLLRRSVVQVATDRPYLPLFHEARLALVRAPFTVEPRTGSWLRPQDIAWDDDKSGGGGQF